MSTLITLEAVVAAMSTAIEERGDYIYPGTMANEDDERPLCHYRWDSSDVANGYVTDEEVGKPACAVGYIFHGLDVLETLVPEASDGRRWDEFPRNETGAVDLLVDLVENGYELGTGVSTYLVELQSSQDTGSSWPVAHRRALQKVAIDHGPEVVAGVAQ